MPTVLSDVLQAERKISFEGILISLEGIAHVDFLKINLSGYFTKTSV